MLSSRFKPWHVPLFLAKYGWLVANKRPVLLHFEVTLRCNASCGFCDYWKTDSSARATEADKLRRIPDETIAAFRDAGFFRMLQPSRWGGLEVDPRTFFDVQMTIARACPSSAWVLGVVAVHAWQLALFPLERQKIDDSRDPRTVDANGDIAECLDRGGHDARELLRIRNVAGREPCAAARRQNLGRHCSTRLRLLVDDQHSGALGCEAAGDRRTDALRCARDDGGLVA